MNKLKQLWYKIKSECLKVALFIYLYIEYYFGK